MDRWLFMDWVETQLQHCMEIPSKTGWSPLPNGFRDFMLHFSGKDTIATDCSAFDWTWKAWMVEEVLRCKLQQCRSPDKSQLETYRWMVFLRFSQVLGTHATVRLPDGQAYRQDFWGFMKSGWYLTISLNGDCQVVCNALAWIRLHKGRPPPFPNIWVMGDDVIMETPKGLDLVDYVEKLSTTGLVIKEWSVKKEFAGFGFAGSLMRPEVQPLYPQKHKYLLAYTGPDQIRESLVQMNMLYSLSKERDWLDQVSEEYVPYSDAVFRAWAFGLPCVRIKPTRSVWIWED